MTRKILTPFISILALAAYSQVDIDLSAFDKNSNVKLAAAKDKLNITWPTSKSEHGKIVLDLENNKPLFSSIQLSSLGVFKEIAKGLDPAFLLTIGKRDLVSQNGWNIFFDKTNKLPHQTYIVQIDKRN